jgi:hypothetical protein
VIFDEYRIGADLMGNAAGMLAKYGNVTPDQKAALEALVPGAKLGPTYEVVVRTVTGIPEEGKLMAMPGDIFEIARSGREPMWRTEAILKLGPDAVDEGREVRRPAGGEHGAEGAGRPDGPAAEREGRRGGRPRPDRRGLPEDRRRGVGSRVAGPPSGPGGGDR